MEFEIPYNFDTQLIDLLDILCNNKQEINCIYLPPFLSHYQTILRSGEQAEFLSQINLSDYEFHIKKINDHFSGKIQLLLQNENLILEKNILDIYINKYHITKFCIASIEQGKIIKSLLPEAEITGSISMNINQNKIENNFILYKQIFNKFVLPFSFCRNYDAIQKLPKDFQYILLINAYCSKKCSGKEHWFSNYTLEENIYCPGIMGNYNGIKWKNGTRIRPMDLNLFKPYISVFKIQDRGWPTQDIIRDYILYSTDYSIYPNIEYKKEIYKNN